MTAPDPQTYTKVAQESAREAVANVVMAMRGEIDAIRRAPLTAIPVQTFGTVLAESLEAWASRLERATKRIDEEKRVSQELGRIISDARHQACGRVGGHLGRECGCWKGTLDLQPSAESRRQNALRVLDDVMGLDDGAR